MISAPDRRKCVELIEEATTAGASCEKACKELGISLRTYQRWTQEGSVKTDERPTAQRPEPANKLTPQEREKILAICNMEAYQSACYPCNTPPGASPGEAPVRRHVGVRRAACAAHLPQPVNAN